MALPASQPLPGEEQTLAPWLTEVQAMLGAIGRASSLAVNPSAPGTTTSAVSVDFPTPSSFTFTKRRSAAETSVKLSLSVSGVRAATAAAFAVLGVKIGVTDYDFASLLLETVNLRQPVVGFQTLTGIPAGTYSVQVRWRRASGTGTLTVDANDRLSIIAEEISV